MNQPHPPPAHPRQIVPLPQNSPIIDDFDISCPFTSCRAILETTKSLKHAHSPRRHLTKLHLKTPQLCATGTAAQHKFLRFRLDEIGLHLCKRYMRIVDTPCAPRACRFIKRPKLSLYPVKSLTDTCIFTTILQSDFRHMQIFVCQKACISYKQGFFGRNITTQTVSRWISQAVV